MAPDSLERRCPRLGGDVNFSYCRSCGEQHAPCFKIFDCWWERFDVVAHLKAHLAADDFEKLTLRRPPPDKVTSLVDLIRQAQKRAAEP
ncbi:hypothetical protein [Desulfosarcina ovata]|uniref:Uncharacterized protein n=1 Tax=Desulfosarcina ovata subsp. ovata TaxID=2752305 RepID=A0A5K8AGC9_9BACT|nr:hypothetical protein [Desulfosarcina ovata]BBO90910.1 hypothetical protein DSCOOX_40900 [Desulfosarcina ovata subsp. ovata]